MSEENIETTVRLMMSEAIEWLLSKQHKGGWGGDVRATCYVLQALVPAGISPLEKPVVEGCRFLRRTQSPATGTWNENDGDTAEALRTAILCKMGTESPCVLAGIKGLSSLKTTGKILVRSEVGWIHPILVARAFSALGEKPSELLEAIEVFLTGEVTYQTKYTSRAVLAFCEEHESKTSPRMKKAEAFLKSAVNEISNLSYEDIGYLLQALSVLGYKLSSGTVERIVDFLKEKQSTNGSWEDNAKDTAQIVSGLAMFGIRYKKPSILRKSNLIRILVLSALLCISIILYFSDLEKMIVNVVNIVEFFIGIIVILQWVYPTIRVRV
ncbi:MAG: hypothetical protein OEY81_01840 [Candidatus Bathyarchaeota archaeon]|nr:hypothetical protein [Candidatus Bathyarchaeota archaeon]